MKPTQEQVIAWALEVDIDPHDMCEDPRIAENNLERLVTLAYEAGRESAKLDSTHTCHDQCQRPACVAVREAYESGRKDENEACATVCEDETKYWKQGQPPYIALTECAVAIRARREQ